jgi:ASC-1-like (ASCH) protein
MDHEAPVTNTPDQNNPTTMSLSSPLYNKKRKVQFGTVVINEHPIIVGCNPAVSSGVPLSIDWDRISQSVMSIHDYETIREPVRVEDLSMILKDSSDRYYMLQNLGYSYKELREAEKAVDMIRKFRQQSYEDYEHDIYMDNRDDDKCAQRLRTIQDRWMSRNGNSSSRTAMSKSIHQFSVNLIPRRLRLRSALRVQPVTGSYF